MSVVTAAKLARRELRGGLRGFRIFLACLILGVAAIAAIGSVRASIEAGLSAKGSELLGGDAEMEFTYRFANEDERTWMQASATAVSEIVDFRSMAVVTRGDVTERGLTQIKAVDSAYPLVGSVTLEPDMSLAQAFAPKDGRPGAVMHPLLADRLALEIGDIFTLGTQDFHLAARLIEEPDNAGGGFGLGPRTLVATPDLQNSGLLSPGTLYETQYRLLLKDGLTLEATKQAANETFRDKGMRWRDSRNGAPGVARFVERLGSFLVLVGLSGLAVGGVGVSAAIRAYLASKTEVIATLRSLGADRATIFLTYFFQIGVLSLLGISIGLILGAALPAALSPVLQSVLPLPAVISLHAAPLFEAAIYGLLTAMIFTLWPLARTEDIRAAALFRDAMHAARGLPAARYLIATGLLIALLVGAASYFSGNLWLTLWTMGGIAGALVLLTLAAALIRFISARAAPRARHRASLRWALAAISSPREGATSVVLSLGLGLSVLAAVGQIDGNLRAAISQDLPDVAPSYFFVDIQPGQMPGFLERVTTDPAVSKVENAPMLRGVITQINGRPAREVAGNHWVVRGDRGVSYAGTLPDTTKITDGTWWGADYSGAPQISFAAEEAAEIGLKLGDSMTVNILGRDITGTVTSFREVDFSTAGMGFVLVMNEAALAGAPHSFIATVYAEEAAEAQILRDISNAYPNITAIRVRDAIERVTEVLGSIAAATAYGAAATLLTGFLVLIGAAAAGQHSRTYEAAILKTLGATRKRILLSFALRSALLGLGAGVVALGAGILGGWAVSHFVLETNYTVIWDNALAIVLGGVLATLLAGLGFAATPLRARPAPVLRTAD
ncbi:FtsX-like permease family protein [Cognatishimia sp. SS12]|uniref:ABC transporter permease n=1 Tax=Cognatishimia sp. SS12 TaxID=2979465 RepID=UPI0023307331|nr:FtsX-like permease family protein [Cognatishimia sp. SS12]MDC0738972.1 FtsX-like permease family protein [Cognatishimia sp. SS12]